MTEIKYELTNLDDTTRTMRGKGTSSRAGGYEEVWLGNHSGIDVWAGIDYGIYHAYKPEVAKYLSENYTEKQLKDYDNYLSPYEVATAIEKEKVDSLGGRWTLVDVNLYFYVYGVEVSEHYTYARKQEMGVCPEANLIALDKPQAFGLLDVVKNIVKNDSLFDYALRKAVMDANSLAIEMTKALEAGKK